MINSDVKLPQPEVAYGAVYGRDKNKKNKLLVAFWISAAINLALFGVLVLAAILEVSTPEALPAVICGIFAVIILPFTIILMFKAFTYDDNVFTKDVTEKRTKYAHTQFKNWFQQRYETEISKEQALALMNGKAITVQKGTKPKTVKFERTEDFRKLTIIGTEGTIDKKLIENWYLDTDKIDFQLIFVKQPKKPKVWS